MTSYDIWISIVVATFVVYRLSLMAAREEGPFDIFLDLRGLLWETKQGWIQAGSTCPSCWGFWISLPIAFILYYTLRLDWPAILWLWFGLSGASSFLHSLSH